ncbi:MAG: Serine/threonine-protein kinase pkn1 [Deltaproteobacteria bacterium ADurb.Bin058]|nr:MAG: Serine/threonine-protein kinase pkn1 [Deltaproteobacteria bacterium ADurb.Bin058]
MHVSKYLATLFLALAMTFIAACDDSAHRAWVIGGVPMGPDIEVINPDPSCTPACGDRVCGLDPVCGESCGSCSSPNTCTEGQCECIKDCSGRVCGPDPVCSESCGSCSTPNTCNSQGQCECIKDCSGRVCGPDPFCGESCGSCSTPNTCNSQGQCECVKNCSGRVCGPDPVCGESCGSCSTPNTCNSQGQCECVKNCSGRVCVLDPVCGEFCGCSSSAYCDDDRTCIPSDRIKWVRITGGSFDMGSSGHGSEQPVHSVTVPTFEMSKTEVTVAQYRACVYAGACTAPDTGDYCNWGQSDRGSHPINCVDWDQARAFASWAGARLPSEAEWEYAARSGGRDWKYPWGDGDATCERAVMDDGSGNGCGRGSTTWPVCSKPRGNTTQGLCDMAGNVREWVQDWYHDTYDGAPTDGSAWESPTGFDRVARGGSWEDYAVYVRAADRYALLGRGADLGFRLARDSL